MPVPPTGAWQPATLVEVRRETPTAKTFRLRLPDPTPYWPGQHVILRLTAEDGYRAQRSYSVATPPTAAADELELTVELLPDGEVSSFLHEVAEVGDELELRGPVGGFFAWDGAAPAYGVGGGSGVVPLMAMLRAARRDGHAGRMSLLVSARSPRELYFAGEMTGDDVSVAFTREVPAEAIRPAGRIGVPDVGPAALAAEIVFVCGSPGFCDAATSTLTAAGVAVDRIRVERFGPSG